MRHLTTALLLLAILVFPQEPPPGWPPVGVCQPGEVRVDGQCVRLGQGGECPPGHNCMDRLPQNF
jgi:hypothetical protein